MTLTRSPSLLTLFVVFAILIPGCGQKAQYPNVDTEKRDLDGIFSLYRRYLKTHQRGPASLSELSQNKSIDPRAFQLLQEGKYIAVWGVNDKSGETILAYEKDAPTNGGWALMADGKVKRLDASAFQNVPKPAK